MRWLRADQYRSRRQGLNDSNLAEARATVHTTICAGRIFGTDIFPANEGHPISPGCRLMDMHALPIRQIEHGFCRHRPKRATNVVCDITHVGFALSAASTKLEQYQRG